MEKNRGHGPGFSFGASVSLYLVVISRLADVPDVQIVRAQHIGRNSTVGNGSFGGGVVVVVVLRSQGGAGEDERGRSGQNKNSHDRILVFLFLKVRRRTLGNLNDSIRKVEPRPGQLFIAAP
jgi:hypothetical protein